MEIKEYACELYKYYFRYIELHNGKIGALDIFFNNMLIPSDNNYDEKTIWRDGNTLTTEEKLKYLGKTNINEFRMEAPSDIWPFELSISKEDQNTLLTCVDDKEANKLLKELRIKARKSERLFKIDSIRPDFIRNSSGDIEKGVFEIWDRCIIAYEKYIEYKHTGKIRFYQQLAGELIYFNNKTYMECCKTSEDAVKQLQADIRTAIIFINRAVNGTFPYDENNEWFYRHDDKRFKTMKL